MAKAPHMDLNATRIDATERDSLIATAREAADAARDVTRKYFRGGALETVSKLEGGFDPVTVADRAAETAMREIIARNRPRGRDTRGGTRVSGGHVRSHLGARSH